MTFTSRQHTVLATVLIFVVAYLTRIGHVEIQPWDEGLYAVRGEAVLLYGDLWDQTEHAIGGLYSSIPAPMPSWHAAIGMAVFGRTAFGVRVIGVLDAGIALFLLFLILDRLVSYRLALVGVVMLGTALHWVVYARQLMSEVPLLTYMLLALWASMRLKDELSNDGNWRRRSVFWYGIAFSIGLGFALLTKLVVGLIPLLFLLPLLRHRVSRAVALVSAALGLLIAMPWYVSMLVAHGAPFLNALLIQHATTVVEGNERDLGLFYYINQLLIAQPLLLFAMLLNIRRLLIDIPAFWFVVTFIALTLAPTKNPHYVVMLIPPAVICAVCALERIQKANKPRLETILLLLVVLVSGWAALADLRLWVRGHAFESLPWIAGVMCLLVLSAVLPYSWLQWFTVRARPVMIGIGIGAAGLTALQTIWQGRPEFIRGGKAVALDLLESGTQRFAYLYHEHNVADSLNPQLAWYTAGWMLGRDSQYSYNPVALPEDGVSLNATAMLATSGTPIVVYYHPGVSRAIRDQVYAVLGTAYRVDTMGAHYSLLRIAR